MKIEIPFEIGENVWYIHPKTMKATTATLKSVKVHIVHQQTQIKYNLNVDMPNPNDEFYVWNVFKTKEDLLKSL